MDLQVGAKVHVLTQNLDHLGLKDHQIRGGEGTVISIGQDSKGDVYTIRITATGKTRSVRRESLVVHRAGNKWEEAEKRVEKATKARKAAKLVSKFPKR